MRLTKFSGCTIRGKFRMVSSFFSVAENIYVHLGCVLYLLKM